jgi:hypothetical protein
LFVNSKKPRDNGGGEANKAKIAFRELVVAGGDAAEVFDAFEEVFHKMSFPIRRLAVAGRMPALGAWRDAGSDAALRKPLAEGVTIVTFVTHEHAGGNFLRHGLRMGDIGFIAGGQQKPRWLACFIDHRVDLGVHPTFGPAHGLGSLPARRIACTAMHFDMGGVQKATRTGQWQLDSGKDLRPNTFACPAAVILIDAIPRRLRSVNRPPLTTLAENDENAS